MIETIKIAGIDGSISSTGKVIMTLNKETLDIIDVRYYGYSDTIKYSYNGAMSEVKHMGTDYGSGLPVVERQYRAFPYIMEHLEDVNMIGMEGYSFTKQSSSLVQLAEWGGSLKKMFYDNDKGILIYPPTSVKMFATGNGQASKIMMAHAIMEIYPEWYPKEFANLKQYESPHEDLCDAFWMCETLRNHMKYDIIGRDSLPDHVVSLLESKSTKKTTPIVEVKIIKKGMDYNKKKQSTKSPKKVK